MECLLKIGGLIQVCNDIFDVNKDIKEGIRTVTTEIKDIKILKHKVQQLYKETFEYCQIAIPTRNMNAFLQQIKIIVSQSFVALDFYEKTIKNRLNTPVIFLSALSNVDDRVTGLEPVSYTHLTLPTNREV